MSQLASARPLTAEEKAQAYGDDLIAQIAQVRVGLGLRLGLGLGLGLGIYLIAQIAQVR